MNTPNPTPRLLLGAIAVAVTLMGCASQGTPPPVIPLDEPVMAQPLPEPPQPVEVVAVPQVLPMPSQMKPLPERASVSNRVFLRNTV